MILPSSYRTTIPLLIKNNELPYSACPLDIHKKKA